MTYRVKMWYLQESNQGHKDFQSFALPTELRYLNCGCKYNVLFAISTNHFAKKRMQNAFSLNLSMDLILDIGNTHIKYHLFSSGKRMLGDTLESLEGLEEKLLGEYSSLQDMIYADVRGKYSHNELCTLFPNLKVHSS